MRGLIWATWAAAYSDLGEVEKAISYYEEALPSPIAPGDRAPTDERPSVNASPGRWAARGGDSFRRSLQRLWGRWRRPSATTRRPWPSPGRSGTGKGRVNKLGNLGNAYRGLGEVEKAISYYEEALAIAREIGHRQMGGYSAWRAKLLPWPSQPTALPPGGGGEGHQLLRGGPSHRPGDRAPARGGICSLGEVEKAISYYEEALAIAREIGHRQNEGIWLGNLGAAYSDLGEVEKAISYYEEALAIAREIGHRQNEGSWLGNLGLAYSDLGEVEKAISYYEEALAIDKEIGYRQGEGANLDNLGVAYRALGEVEKARHYLEQSLAIFEEIKSPNADLVRSSLEELESGEVS